jgi:uncharacterized membrane protein YdbT with pleckstrin-like domain
MPLPKNILNDNEELVLDLHPHWWYFANSVATTVGVLIVWMFLSSKIDRGFWNFIPTVSSFAFLIAALWVVYKYVQWRSTHFAVTGARVIYQQGFIAKKGVEIPLERVNNVNFSQTIIERVLGAGDLLIESGGQDGQQRFSDILRPQEVKKVILEQVERRIDRRNNATAAVSDVASQLEKLEGLLHRGSITQEEFDREKRRLLG